MTSILQMRKLRQAEGRWLCLMIQLLVYDRVLPSHTVLPGIRCWQCGAVCLHTALSELPARVSASQWEVSRTQDVAQWHCYQGPSLIKALSPVDSSLTENLGILARCLGCTTGVQSLDPSQGLTASQEWRGNWVPFREPVGWQC